MRAGLIWLVRLFPTAFRAQFAADMVEQLERDYAAARARGARALLWFVAGAALDLLVSAIAEWVHPAWRIKASVGFSDGRLKGSGLMQDLRFATRVLTRAPGFTAIAAGTLGLAIGANAAVFAVVDKVLLDPLPYHDADRLVHITATAPGTQMPPEFGVGREFYIQYKEQSRLLRHVVAFTSYTATLRANDRVERVAMSSPTNSFYATLGVKPVLGRLPVAEDENHAVVISYALWTTWFGRDSSVLGRSYQVDGQPRRIIGVMGPGFRFPDDGTMLWISGDFREADASPGNFELVLVGRMIPGATREEVARELTALSKRLPERFGGSAGYARIIEHHYAVVRSLEEAELGAVARPLWVIFASVGIVLLIACANVANLLMVRAEGRQRELIVRRAIGAARGQLVRLQMMEALVIAGLAAVLAVALAWLGLPALLAAAPPGIPRLADVRFGATAFLVTAGAALGSALACGLVPAIRGSSPVLTRLREVGRTATHRRHWGRHGLVAAQTAMALVLLIGAGLLMRSFVELSKVDPGYDTRDLFTFQIAPEGEALRDGPSFARFDMELMDRLRALPGVELVGVVNNLPLDERTNTAGFSTQEMGRGDPTVGVALHYTYAAGDYFRAMGIRLLVGETFASRDLAATHGKVVISKSAAQLLWPGQSAVGRQLLYRPRSAWLEVIGVVDDVLQNSFRGTPDRLVYLPLVGPKPDSWRVSSPAYVLKTSRAAVIAPQVRALVRETAPSAPMYAQSTMEGLVRQSTLELSFTMLTLGIVSALALLLGAVGLYGVLSYVVAARTKEIGVRMALGARPLQVRGMVVLQGIRVVGVGVLIGLVVALASTRVLGSLLFGVAAADAPTFVGMSAAMVVVGLLAAYMPARRASNVDPMESLRSD